MKTLKEILERKLKTTVKEASAALNSMFGTHVSYDGLPSEKKKKEPRLPLKDIISIAIRKHRIKMAQKKKLGEHIVKVDGKYYAEETAMNEEEKKKTLKDYMKGKYVNYGIRSRKAAVKKAWMDGKKMNEDKENLYSPHCHTGYNRPLKDGQTIGIHVYKGRGKFDKNGMYVHDMHIQPATVHSYDGFPERKGSMGNYHKYTVKIGNKLKKINSDDHTIRTLKKSVKEETEMNDEILDAIYEGEEVNLDEAHVAYYNSRYRGVTQSGKKWSAPEPDMNKAKNILSAEKYIRSKYPAGHKVRGGFISIHSEETVNELSKGTLKSYVAKGVAEKTPTSKIGNRIIGLWRANKKLAKKIKVNEDHEEWRKEMEKRGAKIFKSDDPESPKMTRALKLVDGKHVHVGAYDHENKEAINEDRPVSVELHSGKELHDAVPKSVFNKLIRHPVFRKHIQNEYGGNKTTYSYIKHSEGSHQIDVHTHPYLTTFHMWKPHRGPAKVSAYHHMIADKEDSNRFRTLKTHGFENED